MKPITSAALYEFCNPNSFTFSPDGSMGAFLLHQADKEKNGYNSDLYLLEGKSVRQLTASHDVSSFIWTEDNKILFPAARDEKVKKKQDDKIPCTAYYLLDPKGGEALPAFEIPLKVIAIQQVSGTKFLLTAVVHKEDPDWPSLTEKEREQTVKDKEKIGYYTFDELPFWSQGRGVWNGNRNALYLFDSSNGSIERITGVHFDTAFTKVVGDSVYYTGADFSDINPPMKGAFRYDIHSKKTTTLISQGTIQIYMVLPWGEKVLVVGAIGGTVNDTPDFYTMNLDGSDLKLFADWDSCIGHGGLVSDARGGSGQGWKLEGQDFYFLSILENVSCLCRLSPDGKISAHLTPDGSADFFDVSGERVIYGGFFNGHLNELYENGEPLTHFNDNFLEEYSVLPAEHHTFTASDGYLIHGWAIKPLGYTPGKKYPAILNIHGGPRGTYGDIFCHEMQQWANAGYFVFFCNPRGSEGRGDEFADVYGKYGTIDYDNLMEFADEMLRVYPDADANRFGVTGGSYGGYMTNWIIGHTDRFKAAVSQRSISNWLLYEFTSDIGYTFMHRHILHTAFEDYTKTWDQSPLKYAPNAKTPTLFIHSDNDFRCWMGEGISMFNALKTLGVPAKLCLFRGESHELSRSGKPWNREGRLNEILGWFQKYLVDDSSRKESELLPLKKYMPPLWLAYPWISQFSIGWRMGVGEGYKYKLWDWLDALPEKEREEWERRFPQPAFWQNLSDEDEEETEPENGLSWYSYGDYLVPFWRERGVPMLDIAALREKFQGGDKMDFCFFWGGKKKADIGSECFSQWYPSEFDCDTDHYICMEQYMMAEKARLFGDKEICAKIMESREPNKIKALGRKVKNFDQSVWDACKYSIVLNGNYLKFIQNPKLKEFLLSTGDKVLAEASPYDGIWGIRMGEKSPDVRNPMEWQGENLLGFALMEVREELRRVCANEKLIDWNTVEN